MACIGEGKAHNAGPGQLGEKRVDAYECVLFTKGTKGLFSAGQDRIGPGRSVRRL